MAKKSLISEEYRLRLGLLKGGQDLGEPLRGITPSVTSLWLRRFDRDFKGMIHEFDHLDADLHWQQISANKS
jgi:hypothetical protein